MSVTHERVIRFEHHLKAGDLELDFERPSFGRVGRFTVSNERLTVGPYSLTREEVVCLWAFFGRILTDWKE